jgi:hypothetical protein
MTEQEIAGPGRAFASYLGWQACSALMTALDRVRQTLRAVGSLLLPRPARQVRWVWHDGDFAWPCPNADALPRVWLPE